jgi:hypothetical protein
MSVFRLNIGWCRVAQGGAVRDMTSAQCSLYRKARKLAFRSGRPLAVVLSLQCAYSIALATVRAISRALGKNTDFCWIFLIGRWCVADRADDADKWQALRRLGEPET